MESQDRDSCAVGHGCNAGPTPSTSSVDASPSTESRNRDTPGEQFLPAVRSKHSLSVPALASVELSYRTPEVRGPDLRKRSRRGRESGIGSDGRLESLPGTVAESKQPSDARLHCNAQSGVSRFP